MAQSSTPTLLNDLSTFQSITVTKDNRKLFVSYPNYKGGKVSFFRRNGESGELSQSLDLEIPKNLYIQTNARFGETVSVSEDGNFVVVGIPGASGIKTFFAGNFSSSISYIENSIVYHAESLWRAKQNIAVNSLPPSTRNPNFEQVYGVNLDVSGVAAYRNAGAVAIYWQHRPNNYTLMKIFTSNFPIDNKQFGSYVSVSQSNDRYSLFVGSNDGNIEIFHHGASTGGSIQGGWTADQRYDRGDIVFFEGKYYRAK